MNNHLPPKLIIFPIAILFVLCFFGLTFAQEVKTTSPPEDLLDVKKEQARKYREVGLENQKSDNLPMAMSLYQKAIVLDPTYADAYNDLGVVYEASGFPEKAEECYLKTLRIDPYYLSAYTNLAFFYEYKRDLEKAAFYWDKRAKLGLFNDPWTQKAINRLKEIRAVLSNRPITSLREEDVLSLTKDVTVRKELGNKDDKALAEDHFKNAKLSYNKGDLATAIKEALDAQHLDQDNPEIEVFIEKAEHRALTR